MPATILLDLYGTLVEPDWPALLHGRKALAERAGVPEVAAHRAWDKTHAARMVGAYGSLADDLHAVLAEASGGGWAEPDPGMLSELAEEELENWRRGVTLHEDAEPALRLLRSSGTRLAIVTNASAEAASVVDAFDLRSVVDEVFTSCDAGLLKPGLLDVALRTLGVEATDAALVDDEPGQLDAAAGLGLGTVLIRRLGVSGFAASGPHQEVNDLRQLTRLVVPEEPARPR